jgi:hypothetical protein
MTMVAKPFTVSVLPRLPLQLTTGTRYSDVPGFTQSYSRSSTVSSCDWLRLRVSPMRSVGGVRVPPQAAGR